MVAWSRSVLGPWLEHPRRAGVLLDFDGTLAPIVADPASARALPGVPDVLAGLAARYRVVAVVSGRPAAFLAAHLPAPGVQRWGSYGLERLADDGTVTVLPQAETWRDAVASVVARARQAAPDGVEVESKGLSLTLHVRRAPALAAWARSFAHSEAGRTGLTVHDARMSVELRPPLAVDKGTVVDRVVAETGVTAACFAGDDRGDLLAFRALDRVAHPLRIAVASRESPPELLEAADVVVEGPSGLLDLLRALVPPP